MHVSLGTRPDSGWYAEKAPGWIICAGLFAMYLPSVIDLMTVGAWTRFEYSHSPLMLLTALVLMWRSWGRNPAIVNGTPNPLVAWPLIGVGLVLYVVGRALDLVHLELGSAVWMAAGSIVMLRGTGALKALRFPLFFMVFMIPVPSILGDPLSQTMKLWVTICTDWLLHVFGYPVARTGVTLQIGPYELLVAEACAGMRTLFMLEAFGVLYLNLVRHSSLIRNIGMAALIIPISFASNVIRVTALALITYHFGDAAGQGFLHGFAGLVLFAAALMLTLAADSAFRTIAPRVHKASPV